MSGSGATGLTVEASFYKVDNSLIETKKSSIVNGKFTIDFPEDLAENDYVTVVQYKNEAVKSDSVKRIFPPVQCTINPTISGEEVHTTGTGIPNYWIHQEHKRIDGGGDTDVFQISEDGEWRSLNYLPIVNKGDTITVRQSKGEWTKEDERSKPVTITVT